MAENTQQLAAMLVPVLNDKLIVPGSLIAELIPYQAPSPVEGSPDWHLGDINWRDQTVPVVSYERANSGSQTVVGSRISYARIAIVNSISGDDSPAFYGLPLQGIPSTLKLTEADIGLLKHSDKAPGKLEHCQVQAAGVRAVIPDLEKLEALLSELHMPA